MKAAHARRFAYALAASAALHALVLFGGLPAWRPFPAEPAEPPAPLLTRLVELPKAVEEEAKPRARKLPGRRPTKQAAPIEAPPLAAAPAPAETRAEPAPPPSSAQQAAAEPARKAETRAGEASAAAQYRQELIGAAKRHKPPYPAIARENNWAGNVTLEVALRADGRAELSLRRSSGHEVLDRLALDTFQQALRAVPVPAALQGKEIRLQPLVVVYNLTDN